MSLPHIIRFVVAAALFAVAAYCMPYLAMSYCGGGIADGPPPGPGCGYVIYIPPSGAILCGFIAGWGLRPRWLWLPALAPIAGAFMAALAGHLAGHHYMEMFLITAVVMGVLPALGAGAAVSALSGARACPKCGGTKLYMTEDEAKGEGVAWTLGGKILFWMLAAVCVLLGFASLIVGGVLLALMATVYVVSHIVRGAAYKCSSCFEVTTYRAARGAAKPG
jgi:hypothetical protein